MTRYKARLVAPVEDLPRCSVGGDGILPTELQVPACRNCGSQLLLFVQLDIDPNWSLPLAANSHLVIFMCPQCNEIPSFDEFPAGKLPQRFWETGEGHWFAALSRPDAAETVLRQEPRLVVKQLAFSPTEEMGHLPDSIVVGGPAYWLQDAVSYQCSCGAEMSLVMQISENFGFEKQPAAPSQKDSFSDDEYCLFLGNEVYVFACPRQCDPRAVWIMVQG